MSNISRKKFLKTVAGAGGAALAGLPGISLLNSQQDERPNIVLIMADDMGFSDIGSFGSEINTPNLDQLANNGLRFTQFYNYARCCPTRASLLTGLYPHQAGIGHMTSENDWTLRRNKQIGNKHYQGYLSRNSVTLAEVLGLAGYQTFMSGKWHVGTWRPNWPVDRGFDRYFGIIRGAANYFHPAPEKKLMLDDERFDIPDDFYTTDYFSKYASKFIKEADRNKPFFLYTAYNAPHWPLHAWPEDIQKYEGKYMLGWDKLRQQRFERQKEMGLFDDNTTLPPRSPEAPPWNEVDNKEEWDRRMAVYAAMIDRMDQGIGQIIQTLKETGQFDNTLILFISDNGGCAEKYNPKPDVPPGPPNSATAYYLPWANASNTPFRLFKHWVHEGGIASPAVAHWPKGIERIGEIDQTTVGSVVDLMPTILELTGAEYPDHYQGYEIQPYEGESLLAAIKGDSKPLHQPIYWEHEGNRAVRDGRWKLVSYYDEDRVHGVGRGKRTGQWQLYDLENDRTELNNVIEERPDLARELIDKYRRWADRVGVVDWEEVNRRTGQIN